MVDPSPTTQASSTTTESAPRILIYEADPAVRASLVEGLRVHKSCRLYEAPTLKSALHHLRTSEMDTLVIGWGDDEIDETSLDGIQFRLKRIICLRGTEETQDSSQHQRAEYIYRYLQNTLTSRPPLTEIIPSQKKLNQQILTSEQFDSPIAQPTQLPSLITSPPRSSSFPSFSLDSSRQQHLDGAQIHTVFRPLSSSASNDILKIALEKGAQHPPLIVARPTDDTTEDQRACILWVGPCQHTVYTDLSRACRSLNFQLIAVESAQKALKETRSRSFEIAFIYHKLVDMQGLMLVRSLRREVGENLPVAFISHTQDVEIRLEGIHAGVSLFLNDSVSVDLLTQSVRQLQNLNVRGQARVLVIDDDESTLSDQVLQDLQNAHFTLSCLTSPLRVLELLSEIQTDILVIHADMAGLGGFEMCRTLRALPEWQSLPILLMGAQDDETVKVAAYRAGADDYLPTSSSAGTLKTCIEARLERSRVIQERADRDGLTGLLVRRAFNDALHAQMAAARRKGSTVAVCLIDLDHFKSINDTYGHIAGDRVLASMGRLLSSSFRVEDLRGRWGGEEFVVAFCYEDECTALAILERARKEFIRFYFDGENNQQFQATFSAGIACFPRDGETIEDVFKVADKRLYTVKEHGRNAILAQDQFVRTPS